MIEIGMSILTSLKDGFVCFTAGKNGKVTFLGQDEWCLHRIAGEILSFAMRGSKREP